MHGAIRAGMPIKPRRLLIAASAALLSLLAPAVVHADDAALYAAEGRIRQAMNDEAAAHRLFAAHEVGAQR